MFPRDEIGLRLPLHSERRIGQHVIELVARESVVRETVTKGDVVDVLPLDHHVRAADSVGLGVVILAERLQTCVRVQFAYIILSHGQHAARSAGRVVQGLDDAFGSQDVTVRHKEEVHHQANDFTRGKMIAGLFVRCLVEPPDEFLENIAHLNIGDDMRVQVDIAEPGHDEIEPVGLVEFGDVFFESEVFNDFPGAG